MGGGGGHKNATGGTQKRTGGDTKTHRGDTKMHRGRHRNAQCTGGDTETHISKSRQSNIHTHGHFGYLIKVENFHRFKSKDVFLQT